MKATHPPRRIVLLSLEFNYSPFSGNGVLARSIVESLVRRNDGCKVRVICAKPHPKTPDISNDIYMNHGGCSLEIWPVKLPQNCKWKRLDRSGPWQEYADGAKYFANNVQEFQPTDIIAVDWHGMLAWESIRSNILLKDDDCEFPSSSVKVCYYNFRVYSNSEYADDETSFYRAKEQLSCHMCHVSICLSEHDRMLLQKLIDEDEKNSASSHPKHKSIHILYPPLRGDICELANANNDKNDSPNQHLPEEAQAAIDKLPFEANHNQRLFITCMARLSPEKSPHNFVTLLQKLGGIKFLRKKSLIPILCGARSVEEYATQVINDFQALCNTDDDEEAWPCVVINRHLGPKELAAVFSRTLVNVHPSLYDAYGMTIVESAAFRVPSIVNSGGKVGSASLLGEGKGCIAIDLETIVELTDDQEAQKAECVQTLIDQFHSLRARDNGRIAKEAQSKALGWDEMACCQGLIDILDDGLARA